ncbi:creatininase family protein [Pontibacter sp. G13]|uniref:creatininase family protein n=1 Tax=Pontibacter sp. G13 TaxID=3074898 RepID=UPI00288A1880|nr:creatininase family protein [Pontibacter sp. G13]WNJ21027.1 creatininase family protein [Pontibacter sp. G13]
MKPYLLSETNWQAVRETQYEVAVLPWGATEAHNYHLPYGTDNYQNEHVIDLAAAKAWAHGAKVIVLPNVPFGINTGQLDIDLCLNVNPSTQLAIAKDLADVVQRAGIKKLVMMNGHGGNHFKNIIRELSYHFPELFVCAINWFQAQDWHAYFDEPGDHAGEMETSTMMHIRPELVLPLSEAGDGYAKSYSIKAFREGWAIAQRAWSKVTADTGVGNPAAATAEKGKAYLEASALEIANFLVDLAQTQEIWQDDRP